MEMLNNQDTKKVISEILKEGSYLFYEFKDKIKKYPFLKNANLENSYYTKKISPLFLQEVVDSEENADLLSIIEEEVPLYHRESLKENLPNTASLSSSRDCGINNVPSPLQESNFYEVWFRESQGSIQNDILLDVYNKLRWPIINENQYLNASLFPKLARELNSSSTSDTTLEFEISSTNAKDENKKYEEISCVEYLNDVISQKLQAMYSIVDYKPSQSRLLSDWTESLAQSGQILSEDIPSQLSVYLLQDIRYELLRRKFAGSRTLYTLALASIDRQGSFMNTIPAGALSTDNSLFKEKRLLRLISLPGILSEKAKDVDISPIEVFQDSGNGSETIPLTTLVSMYYGSSGPYTASEFYKSGNTGAFPTKYLRDNNSTLEWDNLSGLLSGVSSKHVYPTLDEKIIDINTSSGFRYRTLDDTVKDENGEEVTIYLDRKKAILSASATYGSMFDISANRLLYNSNTLQQLLQEEYPYVTYPVADGNSISLMDVSWIDYIKSSTLNKSRVQDNIEYGAQINKYLKVDDIQYGEYNFFAVTYSSKDNYSNTKSLVKEQLEAEKVENPKYAFLWFCTLKYDAATFSTNIPLEYKLISKIDLELREGVLPLTYPNLVDDKILGLKFNERDPELDDYAKAYFIFCKNDLIGKTIELHKSPLKFNSSEEGETGFFLTKKEDIPNAKALFYVVKKSASPEEYRWSDPIELYDLKNFKSLIIPAEDALTKEEKYNTLQVHPDWYQLQYFLNPYLNFNSNTASPLRHKQVLASISYKNTRGNSEANSDIRVEGASENTALSNLVRMRSMDYMANDSGSSEKSTWFNEDTDSSIASSKLGFYLKRVRATSDNFHPEETDAEYVSIYGDNRSTDLFDSSDAGDSNKRSNIRQNDITKYPCLEFIKGTAVENTVAFSPNYLRLQPCIDDPTEESYNRWVWNEKSDGFTLCVNISLPKEEEWKGINNNTRMCLLKRAGEEKTSLESITPEDLQSEFNLFLEKVSDTRFKVIFEYYPYGLNLNLESSKYHKGTLEKVLLYDAYSNFRISASIACDFLDEIGNLEQKITASLIVNGELDFKSFSWHSNNQEKDSNFTSIDTLKKDIPGLKDLEDPYFKYLFGERVITLDKIAADKTSYNFIPGFPCKSQHFIEVAGEVDEGIQKNCFFGTLYDLRLYNHGYTDIALTLLNRGSVRELFSYSSSNYILGYNLYRDLGVAKEVALRKTNDRLSKITSIRVFNRSVWDSVLVDMYPVSLKEQISSYPQYKEDFYDPKSDTDIWGYGVGSTTLKLKDCIEQDLEDTAEVNNNEKLSSISYISYNNNLIELKNNDLVSLVNTSIYPVVYNKDSLTSVAVRFEVSEGDSTVFKTLDTNPINLPTALKTTDGILEYDADLNLNYTISPVSNFTNWLSKGTHITLSYNSLLQRIMAVYSPTDLAGNVSESDTSQTNHILVPLTVPRQPDLNSNDIGFFDRLNLRGVQISNYLLPLLKATSYYNELRVPVIMDIINVDAKGVSIGQGTQYASKWDALRVLKEGTYYITCKYPFQILPFEDFRYDTNNKAKYAYLYGAVRFKIEVRGVPLEYQLGLRGAKDIRDQYIDGYSSSKIEATLNSDGALLNPLDNRSFPHRAINIDLYVQDVQNIAGKMYSPSSGNGAREDYVFKWKLLGTNHSGDYPASTSYLNLNLERLKNGLVFKEDIPVFFTKSYSTPFFIAKTEKTINGVEIRANSADDDLISPIKLNPRYEAIKVSTYIKCSSGEAAIEGVDYYDESNNHVYPAAGSNVSEFYIKVENSDKLEAYKESDLDSLVLAAGRSYKLLWDYRANLSEFSYTSSIYSLTNEAQQSLRKLGDDGSVSYSMTDSEKVNYARLASILGNVNSSEYMYTQNGQNYEHDSLALSKTCGYGVTSLEFSEVTVSSCTDIEKIKEEVKTLGEKVYSAWITRKVENFDRLDNPSRGIVYYAYNNGTYLYKKVNDSGELEELTLKSLKSFTDWDPDNLGEFFCVENNPIAVYRAEIEVDNTVFLVNSKYYRWNGVDAEEMTLKSLEDISDLPITPTLSEINTLYEVEGNTYYGALTVQEAFFSKPSDPGKSNAVFSLGNPYSRSAENNYLLSIKESSSKSSRFNIDNSYFYSYIPTEIPEHSTLSALPFRSSIEAYKNSYKVTTTTSFDELATVKAHYERIKNSVDTSIRQLTGSSAGVITALSEFEPSYNYSLISKNTLKNSYVRDTTHSLHAYYASDRTVPSRNEDIVISRRGLYSNNLLTDQDFDNPNSWTWDNSNESSSNIYNPSYVADEDWDDGLGKDVYRIEKLRLSDEEVGSNSANPLVLRYKANSGIRASTYEIALNVKIEGEDKFYIYRSSEANPPAPKQPEPILLGNDQVEFVSQDLSKITDITGEGSKYYVWREGAKAWKWKSSKFTEIPLAKKEEKNLSENTLCVDSPANSFNPGVLYLNNGNAVTESQALAVNGISQNSSLARPAVLFSGIWYNYSHESDHPVEASTIAYTFVCSRGTTFRITKAVARTSNYYSPLSLGLSDCLYNTSSADSLTYVALSSHKSVVFKNLETKELLPIQFNAYLVNRKFGAASISTPISGLSRIDDYISSCSLGFPREESKLATLYDPNTRRMHYKRQLKSNIIQGYSQKVSSEGENDLIKFYEGHDNGYFWKEITPNSKNIYLDLLENEYYRVNESNSFELIPAAEVESRIYEEVVTFNRYNTAYDAAKVPFRREVSNGTTDLYESAIINYDFKDSENKKLKVESLKLNTSSSSPLNHYSTNLQITSEIITNSNNYMIANGPLTLSNETVSTLTNCFDPDKYRKDLENPVAITNIQLMGPVAGSSEAKSVLYEFEYPPIVYRERDQHISYNIILHKPSLQNKS